MKHLTKTRFNVLISNQHQTMIPIM